MDVCYPRMGIPIFSQDDLLDYKIDSLERKKKFKFQSLVPEKKASLIKLTLNFKDVGYPRARIPFF